MKTYMKNWFLKRGYIVQIGQPFFEKVFPFFWNKNLLNMISNSLLEKTQWNIDARESSLDNNLANIWRDLPDGHKWHHYFPIYEKIFSPLRNQKIKILEIGVYKGASLELWRRYFENESVIVGIDIDKTCQRFNDPSRNIHIRIGAQQDLKFLQTVVDEFGPFDLIIDDGSHVTSHIIDSFNFLFENCLYSGGVYFVEDTHSNYWMSHRDGNRSFLDLSKTLTDLMNYHYTILNSDLCFQKNHPSARTSLEVPKITQLVDEIRFFDSIVVFYKNENRFLPVSEHL